MRPFRACSWTLALAGVVALGACGARTGLLVDGGAGDGPPGGGPCDAPSWILFDVDMPPDAGVTGIYAMRPDGTSLHTLALPDGPAFFPSVSPDGTKLLYAAFMTPVVDGGPDSTLYLYDFATGTATAVLTTTQLTYSALSPDGRTVAYTTGYDLHDVGVDGTNDRALLVGPNCGTGYGHPTFTADSRTVVYGTGGVVGAIGVDGSNNETLVAADPGALYYPNAAFSPDYASLVLGGFCSPQAPDVLAVYPYASLPGASCESGQVLTDVSFSSSYSMGNDPSWGTNGLIAYGSDVDVYVIPEAGGQPTDLTSALTGDAGLVTAADPVWAPGCVALP